MTHNTNNEWKSEESCKKISMRAKEEQIIPARAKHHEQEEDTGGTRRRGKNIGNQNCKERNKGSIKKEERKIALNAATVTWVLVSASKPIRGSCHTICHLLPTLAKSDVKCQYCRCRASSSEQSNQYKQ